MDRLVPACTHLRKCGTGDIALSLTGLIKHEFSENSIKSTYKIEESGNLPKIERFFVTYIFHTYGAITPPRRGQ